MSDIPLVVGTSTSLQEEIARLDALLIKVTRERDKARAAVAKLARLTSDRETSRLREMTRERDSARAELDTERARLIGRIQTLAALLREVEWGGPAHTKQRWECEQCARYHVGGSCEWCGACRWKGHAPDCRLHAALAQG